MHSMPFWLSLAAAIVSISRGNVSYQSANLSTAGIRFVAPAYAQEKEITFDHSLYGEVLEKYVEDGMVDYKGLKNDRSLLHRYLARVAALDPEVLNSMPDNEKLAFYFNTYNALTLKVIIEHYPVRSIRDIPDVWDKMQFTVARKKTTLDHIEHGILRKQFKEPLIHFALVCASKSCATLRGEPYTGEDLYRVLEQQAYRFMNDESRNRLDKERNTLYLSSYFKWFKEDFGDVIAFVSKYLPEDDARFIQGRKVRIRYFKYDWSLNEKGSYSQKKLNKE